jgi:predicted neuraminidase
VTPLTAPNGGTFHRSGWADAVYPSWSDDEGETWTAPVPTELPNNNSSIQATVLADGRLAMVLDPTRAEAGTPRRLSLYDEIDDEGWRRPRAAPSRHRTRTAHDGRSGARPGHR